LGDERANSLVRRTLGDLYRRYGEEFWRTKNENSFGKFMASAFATYANEDALDYTVIEQSQDAFAIDVRRLATNHHRQRIKVAAVAHGVTPFS